jgi:adenylate cyclase
MLFGGNPEDTLDNAERAMALSPLDPGYFLYLTAAGFAHLVSGHPDKALELAKRSISLYPNWDSTYWLLITAYTQLQRLAEAQAAVPKFLSLSPGATISTLRRGLPFRGLRGFVWVIFGHFRSAGACK